MKNRADAIFVQFLNAIRQPNDWDLSRVSRTSSKLLTLLTNLTTHRRVSKILALPKFANLTDKHPTLPFVYLGNLYLKQQFTSSDRCSAFMHHYNYLHAKLPENILGRILFEEVTLWEESVEMHQYSLVLSFSHPVRNEGELSISFSVDGIKVFLLSFTIVPGCLVGLQVETAFLISRMQGVRGHFQQIRLATKAFNEVSPSLLLIAALQGLADAFNIQYSAAVCAADQICNSEPESIEFKAAYDEFWISLGATKDMSNVFHIPFPLPEKSLKSIKQKYRSRVKAKRQIRQQVTGKVRQSVQLHVA